MASRPDRLWRRGALILLAVIALAGVALIVIAVLLSGAAVVSLDEATRFTSLTVVRVS
ncbi:MAG TPA: hypothetical protein VMP10_01845 [Chloroflexota bacterium]|nr:hypothetical protein [Chloroflexota bacterium]